MHIDKFKKEDGYYDESECFYEDAESFIQTKLFGFCGCGYPDDNLIYVRDSMRLLRNFRFSEHDEKNESWEEFYKRYRTAVDNHFKSSGAEYFMWYWLDEKGYTEHGGSFPGWLTVEGEELLDDLEETTKTEDGAAGSCGNVGEHPTTQQEADPLVLPTRKR